MNIIVRISKCKDVLVAFMTIGDSPNPMSLWKNALCHILSKVFMIFARFSEELQELHSLFSNYQSGRMFILITK